MFLKIGKFTAAAAVTTGTVCLLISSACRNQALENPADPSLAQRLAENGPIDDPSTIDDVALDIPLVDGSEWIESYRPNRSFEGINLDLYRRRVPILFDMNGRILHTWTNVRAVGRARLGRDGRIAVLGYDNLVKEYSWDGELRWFYKPDRKEDFPHHDFVQLENGNYLVIVRRAETKTDDIREIDRGGNVVWQWRSDLNLERNFPHYDHDSSDPVHANSLRPLPPNRWFEEGDSRFRPGNILVSARNLNRIFIIDKKTREVVWQYGDGLDYQHEANMVPQGYPHAGLILVFNNGYNNYREYRRSAIQAIDPVASKVVWEYRDPGFYSSVAGADQPLPNGNVLITSSESGRSFEVTPQGETVWEWVPPFLPMHAFRYPLDYCPQFASLRREVPEAVPLKRNFPFIDLELYAFTIPEEQLSLKYRGRNWWIIPDNTSCRDLRIPPDASVEFNYGFNEDQLGQAQVKAHFRSIITSRDSGKTQVLLDDTISSSDQNLWRKHKTKLEESQLQNATMCIKTSYEGTLSPDDARRVILWAKPRIRSPLVRTYREGRPRLPANAQEEALRIQQLKALGYVQ